MVIQGMDPLLKDWIQVGSWAVAIVGGLVAAGVAIFQLRASRMQREIELRWNRAKLAGELFDHMFDTCEEALLMLDYYRDNRAFDTIPGDDKVVGERDILNALDTGNRTQKSIYIRERLDDLFYIFERIENAVDDELVIFDDIKYPSAYYAGIMARHKEKYAAYLAEVGFEKAPQFLNRFKRWEDASSGMNIYFAGSIRGGREDQALYLEIVRLLGEYGSVLTEHVCDARLTESGEAAEDGVIHDRDLSWLKESKYVVAEVTTPSLGVGYELGKASEWGKPTLCLFRPGAGRALSAMVAGSGGVRVAEYQRVEELKGIFDQFFGGDGA